MLTPILTRLLKNTLATVVLATLACPALVQGQQPGTLLFPVPAPAGTQAGTQTGRAVATNGVHTIIGSPQDDLGASNAGVARVHDAVSGALLWVLPNPSPASNDNFGDAVAISGTRVVVAASNDDLGAGDAGTVYVFDLAGATPTTPVAVLSSPVPQVGANFGFALGISGRLLAAGAYDYDSEVANSGCVWVFDLESATPTVPLHTLTKPGYVAEDKFGVAVDISGTRVIVGAYLDDYLGTDTGGAYVFDVGGASPTVPVAILRNPSPASGDWFGRVVALSGARAVVGAPGDNTGATDAGSAYVYDLSGETPALPLATLNNPAPATTDQFGLAVAVSGSRVAVGAQLDDAGAADAGSVYVYDFGNGPGVLEQSLANPEPAANDRFGGAAALHGSTLVVGAHLNDSVVADSGAFYSYDLASATPASPVLARTEAGPSWQDQFGQAVAISGTRMVVGAPNDDTDGANAGIVYVYDLASGTPATPTFILRNPTPLGGEQFGYSLAISGARVVVSAYLDNNTPGASGGAAYVYDLSSATPTVPIVTLTDPAPTSSFAFSVDISGTLVVAGANFSNVGASSAGSAHVFDVASATPTVPILSLHNPTPVAGDRFGRAVAISGNRVLVGVYLNDTGAADTGCAYVYDVTSATPTVPVHKLNNPTPNTGDWFGRWLSMSGSRIAIGAALDNTGASDAGSVYVYDMTSATPTTPTATLHNPEPAAGDEFGTAIDISGTRVLVSAYLDSFGAAGAGSAYLYDLSSGTPLVPVATFRNPTPAAQDQYGSGVSIDGGLLAVGAQLDDTVAMDKGHVYVYGMPPDIVVEQPVGTSLTDGSATAVSFGDFLFGASSPTRIFTVRNTGSTQLLNLAVAKGGASAAEFAVNTESLGTFIAPGGSASFSVTLSPAMPGLKTATLQIGSTDPDENPFDIPLTGQAYSNTTDTDGDGMKDWQEVRLSALGFNWQTPNVDLVNTYFDSATENGLYTASQVQDLHVGTPLLQRNPATGAFTMTFGVEKSSTPGSGSWVPFPVTAPQTIINAQGRIEFQFMMPDNTAFFRLQTQ